MRARLSRRRRQALLPILFAGALSLVATAAAGLEPPSARTIPESAFQPVMADAAGATPFGGQPRGQARATEIAPIADPWLNATPPADRARPSLPATQPVAVAKMTTHHSISGRASWYCDAGASPCTSGYADSGGFDAYAAAGPRLRAAIGADWRGAVVLVDGIRVKLIDWCQCYEGESSEKLLDLYHDVYLRSGSSVTVRW